MKLPISQKQYLVAVKQIEDIRYIETHMGFSQPRRRSNCACDIAASDVPDGNVTFRVENQESIIVCVN